MGRILCSTACKGEHALAGLWRTDLSPFLGTVVSLRCFVTEGTLRNTEFTMKRLLCAAAIAALSTGFAFAQSTSTTTGGSSTTTGGSSTTTTMPSTTTDPGTDLTTTSGTKSSSAKDCAPGQQSGVAKQAAPGQQDTDAKSAAPGQMKTTTEGC